MFSGLPSFTDKRFLGRATKAFSSNAPVQADGEWTPVANNAAAVALANFDMPVGPGAILGTDGFFKHSSTIVNMASMAAKTITGVTKATGAAIVVTATDHGFQTGDVIVIYGVVGSTEINNTDEGSWTVTYLTPNTFSLDGTEGLAITAYTSDGEATPRELSLTPPAGKTIVVEGLTITSYTADALIVAAQLGWPGTALTNGLTLAAYNTKPSGAATESRTALKTFFSAAKNFGQIIQAGFVPTVVLNATGNVTAFNLDFPTPIVLDSDLSQYMALTVRDTMAGFQALTARGYVI